MKRFLVLVLVFLLPIQIAWGVSGSYCAHEPSSSHFGHHAHVHQVQPDDGDSTSPLQLHPDCASCYIVTVGIIDAGLICPELSPPRAGLSKVTPSLPSAPAAEPERPKWYLAA